MSKASEYGVLMVFKEGWSEQLGQYLLIIQAHLY